jgi:hypothetical protein
VFLYSTRTWRSRSLVISCLLSFYKDWYAIGVPLIGYAETTILTCKLPTVLNLRLPPFPLLVIVDPILFPVYTQRLMMNHV